MRVSPVLLAVAALAACGPRAAGPVTEPHAAPGAAPMEAMDHAMPMDHDMSMDHEMPMIHETPEPDDPVLKEGKAIFDEVCSACHTVEPPPKLAPPMRMVSMHLRQTFETEAEGVAHILSYAPAPEAGKSILPPHAVERFGLMAPQPLPPETLEKVARYVWSLGEGMSEMGGMGMGRSQDGQDGPGNGMRMRMRRRGGGGR
jgi:mono/diheme cytochrome c family protein